MGTFVWAANCAIRAMDDPASQFQVPSSPNSPFKCFILLFFKLVFIIACQFHNPFLGLQFLDPWLVQLPWEWLFLRIVLLVQTLLCYAVHNMCWWHTLILSFTVLWSLHRNSQFCKQINICLEESNGHSEKQGVWEETNEVITAEYVSCASLLIYIVALAKKNVDWIGSNKLFECRYCAYSWCTERVPISQLSHLPQRKFDTAGRVINFFKPCYYYSIFHLEETQNFNCDFQCCGHNIQKVDNVAEDQ